MVATEEKDGERSRGPRQAGHCIKRTGTADWTDAAISCGATQASQVGYC